MIVTPYVIESPALDVWIVKHAITGKYLTPTMEWHNEIRFAKEFNDHKDANIGIQEYVDAMYHEAEKKGMQL